MENIENKEELAENIYRGLEMTVEELQRTLPNDVDGLSTKQLRRALKAVIAYPMVPEDLASAMSEREQRFSAGMLALRQAGVQLEIKAIGELQREYDLKQQEETKGEE